MKIAALGHVVLRVRDLERAEAFYHGVLGIPVSARAPEWSMVFFTLGEHHDFAIAAVEGSAAAPSGDAPGLDHLAFRLAGGLAELRAAKDRLEAAGMPTLAFDHTVTHSLYVRDPDGNRVELYVNTGADWRENPALILSEGGPLAL